LLPLTVIADDPVGVTPVVLILRDVLIGELLEPVVMSGLVPNVAVAPAGRPLTVSVTSHSFEFPPTARLTV